MNKLDAEKLIVLTATAAVVFFIDVNYHKTPSMNNGFTTDDSQPEYWHGKMIRESKRKVSKIGLSPTKSLYSYCNAFKFSLLIQVGELYQI